MKKRSQKIIAQQARNPKAARKAIFEVVLTVTICLAIGALGAWRLIPLIDGNLFLSADSAYYLTLGRSLSRGQGYFFSGMPHTQYPPLYPLLAASVQHFAGMDFRVLRLTQACLGIGAAILAFLYAKRPLGFIGGTAVAVLLIGNRDFALQSAIMLLSEPLFLLLTLLSILLARKSWQPESSLWWTIPAALAAGSAALTRSVAAYSLPLLALAFLTQNRFLPGLRRAGLYLLVFVVLTGAWSLRNHLVAPEDSGLYLRSMQSRYGLRHSETPRDWKGSLQKIKNKAAYEQVSAVALTLNRLHEIKSKSALLGVTLLLLAGWTMQIWRDGRDEGQGDSVAQRSSPFWMAPLRIVRTDPVNYYVAVYFAIYSMWPFEEQNRFLLPILPMLLVYALTVPLIALKILLYKAPPWAVPAVSCIVLMLLCGLYWSKGQPYMQAFPKDIARSNSHFQDTREALGFLSGRERQEVIFYSMRPSVVALAGNVQALGGYRLDSSADFPEYLSYHQCKYIEAVENNALIQEYLKVLKKKFPKRLALVSEKGSVKIYRYSLPKP